jgi:hypothetical protein
VLVVVIVNSREIPWVNKKRRFWPEKSDTAMKNGYVVKTWDFPKARTRSPSGKINPKKPGPCRFLPLCAAYKFRYAAQKFAVRYYSFLRFSFFISLILFIISFQNRSSFYHTNSC